MSYLQSEKLVIIVKDFRLTKKQAKKFGAGSSLKMVDKMKIGFKGLKPVQRPGWKECMKERHAI